MDATQRRRISKIDDGTGRAIVVRTSRRTLRSRAVLADIIADLADVPAEDVELDPRCPTCGTPHGRPRVVYPVTASGRSYSADLQAAPGLIVAAVARTQVVGVGLARVAPIASSGFEEVTFHPIERSALAEADADERAALAAALWARKSALIQAIGHIRGREGPIEPARIAVASPGSGEQSERAGHAGDVMRSVPELDRLARQVRFVDLRAPNGYAASVALLS